MDRLVKKIISKLEPPDIRKVYKAQRSTAHFFVRNAAKISDGHFDRTVTVRDGYRVPIRIYPPRTVNAAPRMILFFHGGGWVIDDIDRYHKVCRQLADISGSWVVSVDYRLAPEHKYPIPLYDCYDVTRFIFCKCERYGLSKRNIILMGDSAGGNLAAAVSLMARDKQSFKVHRQILLYPVTACEYNEDSPYKSVHENGRGCLLTAERMRGYLELYLNDISEKELPYVAPIKARSLKYMPKTLIITAENDPLRDEGEAFGRRLYNENKNVMAFRFKDAYHGFFATDLVHNANAGKAVSIIKYFLNLSE